MLPPAIAIKNLKKTYPPHVDALKSVDLNIPRGQFFALLGPNGAGKSTLIGIVSSLVNKTAGSIHIMGVDLARNPSLAKQHLGIMPQEVNLNPFETPMQILTNQAAFYGVPRTFAKKQARHLLTALMLEDKAHHATRRLSGGMKRRLMIARALIHNPAILILDEPTAGVDIEIRQSIWQFLKQKNKEGMTIILTTHYLEEAEQLSHHIAMIDHGKIIENKPTAVLLKTLQKETFLLELATPFTQSIEQALPLPSIDYRVKTPTTLEIDLKKEDTLTTLIERLSARGIIVERIHQKTNRLEKLFLSLIQKKQTVGKKR